MSTNSLIVNIICQVTTYIGKILVEFIFSFRLSVTIESESLKYLGNGLFVLCLDSISFMIFHVLLYHILTDSSIYHNIIVLLCEYLFSKCLCTFLSSPKICPEGSGLVIVSIV